MDRIEVWTKLSPFYNCEMIQGIKEISCFHDLSS
jgi:hypothetical protein